jgi:molybdate-binding protein
VVPAPPPIIAGSHDPLLDWAVRESGSGLALMFGGSLDGLRRFAAGDAIACGLHVFDPASGDHNLPVLHRTLSGRALVALVWAWREQGLIVAKGNPNRLATLADLKAAQPRFVDRQAEAGSRLLFAHLLAEQGMSIGDLNMVAAPALNETDVGLTVAEDRADVGFAVAAVARQLDLDFVPLTRERYDLVIGRHDYFDEPWQKLLWFTRSARFAERAQQMGGYDVAETGRIVLNGT